MRGNLKDDDPFHTDYMLFRNDGDMQFTDVAEETASGDMGFGWGVLVMDFNNDSRMDLYMAQNYARFPGVKFLDLLSLIHI